MNMTHLMRKFWISTSVLCRTEVFQTSSDNCSSLFIDLVKIARGKVFFVSLLSGNKECYFTELLVNLYILAIQVSPLFLGPYDLVLSEDLGLRCRWNSVFSVVSRIVGLKDNTVCSWDGNHFPLPALTWHPVLHSPFAP